MSGSPSNWRSAPLILSVIMGSLIFQDTSNSA
jgi:hypothetical protein